MKLRYDPFPLIFSRGDAVTRLVTLQLFDLGDSPQGRGCLLEMIKRQRADGAFPSQLDAQQWGMRETVRSTLLLLRAGLPPRGVNTSSAVLHVLDHRNPDGGWSENPALETPTDQTWLSTERSIVWLTADTVDLLRQVGRADSQVCRRALKWLKATQTEPGGWPSIADPLGEQRARAEDPDATAQVTFLMRQVYGEHDPAYLRGRELFERDLDQCAQEAARGYWIRPRDGESQPLDVYHLTRLLLSWLLDSSHRIQSGYDISDPRIRRMMEALIDIQREDGGWRPFFAPESSPRYTALAVKTLVLSGMLERKGLNPYVDPYAAQTDP
jgi:hypothetical protein